MMRPTVNFPKSLIRYVHKRAQAEWKHWKLKLTIKPEQKRLVNVTFTGSCGAGPAMNAALLQTSLTDVKQQLGSAG